MFKRKRLILAACALLAALATLLSGCSNETQGYASEIAANAEDALPKEAGDPAVLAAWDEYEQLNRVPRYSGGGIFDSIVTTDSGGVNVYYSGVPMEDYIAYNSELKSAGFKLEKGKDVVASEGGVGTPVYKKADVQLTLVWIDGGMFAVCAERP